MKRFAERVSKDMGLGGEITADVMSEVARRLKGIPSLVDLDLNERGNTWLVEDGPEGRQYFLAQMGESRLSSTGVWLEVSIVPANYPGFRIRRITGTEAQMASYIRKEWAGAFARKCHIEGVELDKESCVIRDEGTAVVGVCCEQALPENGRCEHCGCQYPR